MERIGIFGGTFNPVHIEHIKVALRAIEELRLDKLFIVPDNIPPHKDIIPLPAKERIKMLKLAFSGHKNIEISDCEIKREGKSYTYLTVEHFKELYPNAELFFIVGKDMLIDFKNWKNPERILELATLAAFGRKGTEGEIKEEEKYFLSRFNKKFLTLSYQGEEVSSTRIRIYSSLGLSVYGMTDKKVADYIKRHGLYSDKYSEYIRRNLPEKRRIHTACVVITAESKMKELDLSPEKVRLAALLHDCAKYQDPKDYADFNLPPDVPPPVVHAFLGAYVAEKVLGIADEEIIDAIRYHTSGKAKMSTLGQLIFVADMVEENRTYDGVERLRVEFNRDFFSGFKLCLSEEMEHLKQKDKPVYGETINAYNYYIKGETNGQ